MKIRFSVIMVFSFSILLQAQIDSTMIELNGIEDPLGNTHLVYEARNCTFNVDLEGIDSSRKSISYYNISTQSDSLVFYEDNIFLHGSNIVRIQDYAVGWDNGIIFNIAELSLGPWFSKPGSRGLMVR